MASVKISDRLYRDIVRRARKIGEVKYDNIRKNPPKIEYENVPFPTLPRYKVIGLVTIYPINKVTSLLFVLRLKPAMRKFLL